MLNVTQSAISHGMPRLEDQLGCRLIYKKGKTTHLTPEGRHFLGQILRILGSPDRAAESISSQNESRAKLSVIFSTSMAQVILAPVLREFRESYPTVSLVVSLEDSPKAVQEVEEGRADLAPQARTNLHWASAEWRTPISADDSAMDGTTRRSERPPRGIGRLLGNAKSWGY
jgi:DNA-binding transcriptional LysR family regulator